MKISPADFQYVQTLARTAAAIVIDADKGYLVESRLEPLAAKLGCANIGELLTKVRAGGSELQKRIIEALTIHETYFFRDFKPFEAARKHIFPELAKTQANSKQINIWSAACSSGQEPYSISILLREAFNLKEWKVRVIATDISEAILNRAKQGVYSQLETGRGLSALYQGKYFERCENGWRVHESVRSMVEFQPINLAKDWPFLPPMDIIFLRNVMIYFENETKKKILEKVRRLLKPTGFLFLGAAESPIFLDASFQAKELEQAVCYTVMKEAVAIR